MLLPLAACAGAGALAVVAALRLRTTPPSATTRPAPPSDAGLYGHVRWADGRDAGGARVSIDPVDPGLGGSVILVEANGSFRFHGAVRGAYSVGASVLDTGGLQPRMTACSRHDRVWAFTGPVEITLVRLLPIRGTVVDSANRPLADIEIEATAPEGWGWPSRGATSNSAGRFEVWAPEDFPVDVEGVRVDWFNDMGNRHGPIGRVAGVHGGTDGVILSMPDE